MRSRINFITLYWGYRIVKSKNWPLEEDYFTPIYSSTPAVASAEREAASMMKTSPSIVPKSKGIPGVPAGLMHGNQPIYLTRYGKPNLMRTLVPSKPLGHDLSKAVQHMYELEKIHVVVEMMTLVETACQRAGYRPSRDCTLFASKQLQSIDKSTRLPFSLIGKWCQTKKKFKFSQYEKFRIKEQCFAVQMTIRQDSSERTNLNQVMMTCSPTFQVGRVIRWIHEAVLFQRDGILHLWCVEFVVCVAVKSKVDLPISLLHGPSERRQITESIFVFFAALNAGHWQNSIVENKPYVGRHF